MEDNLDKTIIYVFTAIGFFVFCVIFAVGIVTCVQFIIHGVKG